MIPRKPEPATLSIRTNSTVSSPASSLDESDAEEIKMALSDSQKAPLTVSIPKNIPSPHSRKPNLAEILANNAPPPYTLSSFMAFLSQNHCLENLEFTMDASRYRKHYSKMVNRHPGTPISPLSDECAYVLMLWRRLIDAYIRESGPREVRRSSSYQIDFCANCHRSTFLLRSATTYWLYPSPTCLLTHLHSMKQSLRSTSSWRRVCFCRS